MPNEQTHSAVIQKFTIISGDWDLQIECILSSGNFIMKAILIVSKI